jgi:hypothetical protein
LYSVASSDVSSGPPEHASAASAAIAVVERTACLMPWLEWPDQDARFLALFSHFPSGARRGETAC